jgi:hypothetical protein
MQTYNYVDKNRPIFPILNYLRTKFRYLGKSKNRRSCIAVEYCRIWRLRCASTVPEVFGPLRNPTGISPYSNSIFWQLVAVREDLYWFTLL